MMLVFFFCSSRRRHTRLQGDWSSDVCSSDLIIAGGKRVIGGNPQRSRFCPARCGADGDGYSASGTGYECRCVAATAGAAVAGGQGKLGVGTADEGDAAYQQIGLAAVTEGKNLADGCGRDGYVAEVLDNRGERADRTPSLPAAYRPDKVGGTLIDAHVTEVQVPGPGNAGIDQITVG